MKECLANYKFIDDQVSQSRDSNRPNMLAITPIITRRKDINTKHQYQIIVNATLPSCCKFENLSKDINSIEKNVYMNTFYFITPPQKYHNRNKVPTIFKRVNVFQHRQK